MIYYLYSEAPSTQDLALKYLEDHGTLGECVAFRAIVQSQGYGRRGTAWRCPMGNIALSILLPLTPSLRYRDHLAVYSAEVVQNVLNSCYEISTTLKAPNDIMWEGKKISGILANIVQETPEKWYAAIGLGINVNNTPAINDAGYTATSLAEILGYTLDVESLTHAILVHFQIFDHNYS